MRLDGMDAILNTLGGAQRIDDPVSKIVKRYTAKLNTAAQRHAPVDTGELRRSIVSVYTNGGMTGTVRANMSYAPYVEYGTRFNTAQPFMRPAYLQVKDQFKEELERLVR